MVQSPKAVMLLSSNLKSVYDAAGRACKSAGRHMIVICQIASRFADHVTASQQYYRWFVFVCFCLSVRLRTTGTTAVPDSYCNVLIRALSVCLLRFRSSTRSCRLSGYPTRTRLTDQLISCLLEPRLG